MFFFLLNVSNKDTFFNSSESKGILDEQNINGWTPLMYAACCANLKVVLLLLEEGADTDIKNCDGHTALILASKCGSGDVVNLLIDVSIHNFYCMNQHVKIQLKLRHKVLYVPAIIVIFFSIVFPRILQNWFMVEI